MGSAAPAYRRYASQEPAWDFSPRIDVIRGGGKRARSKSLSSNAVMTAIAIAVILTAVAFFAIVRIGITAATVAEASAAQQVSSEIESARSASASLDVAISTLSGNTTVQTKAKDMNMAAPSVESVVTLDEDLVAVGEDGTLLLSDSIGRVSQAGQ